MYPSTDSSLTWSGTIRLHRARSCAFLRWRPLISQFDHRRRKPITSHHEMKPPPLSYLPPHLLTDCRLIQPTDTETAMNNSTAAKSPMMSVPTALQNRRFRRATWWKTLRRRICCSRPQRRRISHRRRRRWGPFQWPCWRRSLESRWRPPHRRRWRVLE